MHSSLDLAREFTSPKVTHGIQVTPVERERERGWGVLGQCERMGVGGGLT